MNLQSLVVVALRLFALNFLLQILGQIVFFVETIGRAPEARNWAALFLPLLVMIVIVAIAILLWVLAAPIARRVVKDTQPELSLGALTLADCYSVAFIGVGLYYIVGYLPQILNWAHYLLRTSSPGQEVFRDNGGVDGYRISQAVIPFITGLLLFLNGRKWALALARRHTEITPPPAEPK